MNKILSVFAMVLMLGGCCCGGSLFEGPDCNHKPVPAPQPCVTQNVQPVVVMPRTLRLAGVIYFADGSDYLNPSEIAQLAQIAQVARANNAAVKIAGHASHKVNTKVLARKEAINMDISAKRTLKVANTLAGMGVNPQMMAGSAYSDYRPVAIETDAKGEALNRRVEVYLEY